MIRARHRTFDGGRRHARRRVTLLWESLEPRRLLATYTVDSTADTMAMGTLRWAITQADADTSPGTDNIYFHIPASTAPNLNVPVPGFDPINQDWTITLASPLPPITRSVSIDGYTEAAVGVGYNYPADFSSQSDLLAVPALVSGGTYVLSIAPYTDNGGTVRGGNTGNIPFNATAAFVQNQLENLVGPNNVTVSGQTQPLGPGVYTVSFTGQSTGLSIVMQVQSQNLQPGNPPISLLVTTGGGSSSGTPTVITSAPNSTAALDGNNAHVRVIINGSGTGGGTGFVFNSSNSSLVGLAIEGFGIGVSVPNPTNVGDLIQGNFIGHYLVYPVDPILGAPLLAPNNVALVGQNNTQQGVFLGSRNATVGGVETQDSNVIDDNDQQGVLIAPGASGNQVLGNQIGIVGPSINGLYFHAGNGDAGILILSTGTASDPSSIVYASSNIIGGSGAGNLISNNGTFGVHVVGVGATQNLIESNYIGTAPGGGYAFGTGDPGNSSDGVRIDDSPDNQIGGSSASDRNVISSNQGFGLTINGADALGNTVMNNIIGLTADGVSVLGNKQGGVADFSPLTVIGPSNVISANLLGVLISGAAASDVTVIGNLIGTDSTGENDLGNAEAGVDIEGAAGAIVDGDGQGSQVISGNLEGVKINGSSATGILVEGNFIGVDKAGTAARGNSNEGVLIEGGANNTVGGTTAATRNVISTNQWGVRIDGSTATGNLVQGNYIGTDVSGTLPLGDEVDGVIFSTSASNNTIGGTGTGQGNIIANNPAYGVYVESGNADSILSNSIFSNGRAGIVLNALTNANDSIPAPTLTTAIPSATTGTTTVQGSYTGTPNATFLIQFFSNLTADPAGVYEGQTFLGSTTVTTSATGTVTFSAALPSVVAASSFITATATSFSTVAPVLTAGDTSQFSGAILSKAVSVQFSTSAYTVSSTASVATITVLRSGNTTATVSVNYATSNGTAIAGQNYVPASGTLTFQPGQTLQTFTVTILPNSAQASGNRTINLTLSQPAGGAALGSITTATLTITLVPGPPTPPPSATFPNVTAEQLLISGKSITGISLTFSKTMNVARAQDLSNYGFYVFTALYHVTYTPKASFTSLSSAVYNSTTSTVILTPSSPLPFNKLFQITVDGQASPLLHNGLTDTSNNQLLGSSGNPGTPLVITFEAGTKFSYIDSASNTVSLQLSEGGLLELFIGPTGSVQELETAGAVAGKTSLSGSVRKSRGSSGRTALPPIIGSAGVRIKLKPSQFAFTTGASIDAQTQAAPAAVVQKSSAPISRVTPARRVRHRV